MSRINSKRVWIGGLVGGVVWLVWAIIINFAPADAQVRSGD